MEGLTRADRNLRSSTTGIGYHTTKHQCSKEALSRLPQIVQRIPIRPYHGWETLNPKTYYGWENKRHRPTASVIFPAVHTLWLGLLGALACRGRIM